MGEGICAALVLCTFFAFAPAQVAYAEDGIISSDVIECPAENENGYWTKEKMENARPYPMPALERPVGGQRTRGRSASFMSADPADAFSPPSPAEEQTIISLLQLTDEKRSKMQELSWSYKADVHKLRNDYINAREELTETFAKDEPDPEAVRSHLNSMLEAYSALLEKEVDYWNSLNSVLSAEQRAKLWKLFADTRFKTNATQ